ncbi:hypothetical protein KQ51_01165 [Candidatus Izimaplasma bacterium HR1]|jgi:hypothetical protein|uniref:hypothetical protein n=1 Tax=Candidatus Izimoplasma sp. HR1 TaxID=1541959 RepID=UPI0004F7C5C2|nr:hypothetical protein KQ51_01165 [Candidatus Izimaplasma bacterium HR1]
MLIYIKKTVLVLTSGLLFLIVGNYSTDLNGYIFIILLSISVFPTILVIYSKKRVYLWSMILALNIVLVFLGSFVLDNVDVTNLVAIVLMVTTLCLFVRYLAKGISLIKLLFSSLQVFLFFYGMLMFFSLDSTLNIIVFSTMSLCYLIVSYVLIGVIDKLNN